MMQKVHGPLISEMVADMKFEDSTFCECLQKGFPVAGEMCISVVEMVDDPKATMECLAMNELWRTRADFNAKAISMMKEDEYSEEMVKLAQDDTETGFMSVPEVSTEESR